MYLINQKELQSAWTEKTQQGHDDIIAYIFDKIGTTNKYCVEFGAIDGVESSNTCVLREEHNWTGLLLEGSSEHKDKPDINLWIRRLTKDNICDIFAEFEVPKEFDFICVDIDGFDYWLADTILNEYSPRVFMIESNVRFEPDQSMALKYDENWYWDGGKWYGASPLAFKKMFNSHGYEIVCINFDDIFAVRKDVLKSFGYTVPSWKKIYPASNVPLYSLHVSPGGVYHLEYSKDEWEEV